MATAVLPIIKLGRDLIATSILTKFGEVSIKTVRVRERTKKV